MSWRKSSLVSRMSSPPPTMVTVALRFAPANNDSSPKLSPGAREASKIGADPFSSCRVTAQCPRRMM